MILAGIDEAGYGPLLGPLVVSCTALHLRPNASLPQPSADGLPLEVADLPCCWRLLKAAIAKKAPATKGRLLIADSKVVHNLAQGDRLLERGVLAFMKAADLLTPHPPRASQIIAALGCAHHGLHDHPWYAAHDCPLPLWSDPGDLAIASNMLRTALATAGVHIACLRTHVVPEHRYNHLVSATNNKASTLVSITLEHLHHLHTTFGHHGLIVGIDKQGGRDHYTQLLLRTFPDATLRVLAEGDAGSSYLLTEPAAPPHLPAPRRTVIHFREKGETHFLPVALASMICKYLREVCMHTFNAWWCAQIPGLSPTAGYHQDGTRWLMEVEAHLPRLGIRREDLVRCR